MALLQIALPDAKVYPDHQVALRSDPYFAQQWALQNDGQTGGQLDADIDATELWPLTTGGTTTLGDTIVVAVLDRGFNLTHEDFADNIWINQGEIPNNQIDDDHNGFVDDIHGWNFETNTSDVSNGGLGHWHGTPVAGIIGAVGDNGVGVRGVNWQVKIMPLVVGTRVSDIVAAYRYVLAMRRHYHDSQGEAGAFVVVANASFGKEFLRPADAPLWCAVFDSLGQAGILSVASAPNLAVDVDVRGDLPTTCPSPYLMAITNSDRRDQLTEDAGYGPTSIDLGAPGTGIFTLKNNGTYGAFGGTSAAAPHVAGAIALLYALPLPELGLLARAFPDSAAALVKSALLRGVDTYPSQQPLSVSGGRLNVYRAAMNVYAHFGVPAPVAQACQATAFPNPAKDVLFVSFAMDTPGPVEVSMVDMRGKVMLSQCLQSVSVGSHRLRVSLTTLPPGSYVLRIRSREGEQHLTLLHW